MRSAYVRIKIHIIRMLNESQQKPRRQRETYWYVVFTIRGTRYVAYDDIHHMQVPGRFVTMETPWVRSSCFCALLPTFLIFSCIPVCLSSSCSFVCAAVICYSQQVRAGPDMKMFERRIGHALISFTNLDLICAMSVGPMVFSFLVERYDQSNNPKKTKSTKTTVKRQKKQ